MKTSLMPAGGLSRVLTDWLRPDSMFDRDFFSLGTDSLLARPGVNVPSVNIREDEKSYILEVAAPGLRRDDFKLQVDGGILTLSSEKEEEREEKAEKNGYFRKEYSYNSFSRSFTLPDNIKQEKIEAHYDQGILTVTIPKVTTASTKPVQTIPVS